MAEKENFKSNASLPQVKQAINLPPLKETNKFTSFTTQGLYEIIPDNIKNEDEEANKAYIKSLNHVLNDN